jgi:hypothetical protein
MWRETDSWFELQFLADGAQGFSRISANGDCLGVYRADGTLLSVEEIASYTCVNDNAPAPTWA